MQSPTPDVSAISLRCPSCSARLRAARNLLGQICPCPKCRHRVTVRVTLPPDCEIVLVGDAGPGNPSRYR